MAKYGPTRNEHIFRLCVSLFGLGMIAYALKKHGLIASPQAFDALGLGGIFLLGSAIWSGWKLWKRDWAE